MEINRYIEKYRNNRYNFFKWRYETTYINKIILSLGFAFLTAILAQFKFYLPGNFLVPITAQTFAVLLAGIILGKWGGVSQCIYLGFGMMGLPFFANFTGSTIGYLVGFILAAFFIGYVSEKYVNYRNIKGIFLLMLFSTFVLIYIPGLIYLYFFMGSIGISVGIIEILSIAVLPFIVGDIIKIIGAVLLSRLIIPKRSYI